MNRERATLSLLVLMHWLAVFTLAASCTMALLAFVPAPAAVAVGTVLTYLLKTLVERASQLLHNGLRVRALVATSGALLVASITIALTAATLDARVFATPAAIHAWTRAREPVERELQRHLAQADTALASLSQWADDAAHKATKEAGTGGSCPSRPDTQGSRGPVAMWREDDSRIATALAAELKGLLEAARTSTAALLALPKPADFGEVKAGYAAANLALDAAARLTGGGNFSADAVRVLEARRVSGIEFAGAPPVGCGDAARLTAIERAATALAALATVQPAPRMQPGVDVSNPHDVVSRALLRSYNAVLGVATLGRAGSFAGDGMMLEALKTNGIANRETLPLVLAANAELAVALTALLLVRRGRRPFDDNLVDWVRHAQARTPEPGPLRAAALCSARQLANLLYVLAPTDGPVANATTATPSGFGRIELLDDPACRARETGFALELVPYHHAWMDQDYLVIPVEPGTARVRAMAHALRAQGQLDCKTAAAPVKVVADHPDMAQRLQARYGADWKRLRFEVFSVQPAFAQLLRLQAIGVPLEPGASEPPAQGGAARRPHQPLAHRLAARQGARWPRGR